MENTLEIWEEKLEDMGYTDPTIRYSGFYSQGDGASFTTEWIDLEKWLKYHKLGHQFKSVMYWSKQDMTDCEIWRSESHYAHENTVSIQGEMCYGYNQKGFEKLDAEMDKLKPIILKKAQETMQVIYSDLEAVYERECEE